MKRNSKILVTILLLPAMIAELLSGSSPPLEFFNPVSFLFWVLLYGCGVLLIREARVRWGMQWSVVFPAIAYGIIEEGLTTKAMFNIHWVDVGIYAQYGTIFGALIPWSIVLLTFHTTLSTLIPIMIIDLTWPEYKQRPLLGRKGLFFTVMGFILIVILGFITMGTLTDSGMIAFYPHPLLIIGSLISIAILIFLGYKLRKTRIITENRIFSPGLFSVFAFLFMLAFAVVPHQLAENNISQSGIVVYQILIISAAFVFTASQIFNVHVRVTHLVHLVFGSLLFWSLQGVFLEFQGYKAMSLVGGGTIVLLLIWKKRVIKNSIQ